MKLFLFFLVLSSTPLFARRTITLPPIYSNVDYEALGNDTPTPLAAKSWYQAFDFSFALLPDSPPQTITVTILKGSQADLMVPNPSSHMIINTDHSTTFTLDQIHPERFAIYSTQCTMSACDMAWIPIGPPPPTYLNRLPLGVPTPFMAVSSIIRVKIEVEETRGAVTGRVTGRQFTDNRTPFSHTSPPLELGLNNGRPF